MALLILQVYVRYVRVYVNDGARVAAARTEQSVFVPLNMEVSYCGYYPSISGEF